MNLSDQVLWLNPTFSATAFLGRDRRDMEKARNLPQGRCEVPIVEPLQEGDAVAALLLPTYVAEKTPSVVEIAVHTKAIVSFSAFRAVLLSAIEKPRIDLGQCQDNFTPSTAGSLFDGVAVELHEHFSRVARLTPMK